MSLQFKTLHQLNTESLNYQYNEQLSLNFYFKLSDQLLSKTLAIFDYQKWKMMLKYDDNLKEPTISDNAMEWCYILQMRYLDLINNKLTIHPGFLRSSKTTENINLKNKLILKIKNEVPLIIENVQWLKERLTDKYANLEKVHQNTMLNDFEAKKIQDLKKLVREETDVRREAVLKYNMQTTSDELNSNMQLSRQQQIEKDKFIQNIKRKTNIQNETQMKKIKYGTEDLVSSLTPRHTSGYSLPVLTPHPSSDNLNTLTYNLKDTSSSRKEDIGIKYTLPRL